jgi:RimJ/RimL family protein N-acetyltransferase
MDTEGDLPPWRILLPHGDRPPWRPEVKAPPTRAQYSEYARETSATMDTEGDMPPWARHGDRPPSWRPEVKAPPTRAQYSEYAMAQDHENSNYKTIAVLHLIDKTLQRIEDKIDAENLTAQRLEKKIDKVVNMIENDRIIIRNQRTATQKSSCWMCLQGYK